jgi:hypothetical protein
MVAVALAALVAPAAGHAATAQAPSGELAYTAGPGEANRLTLVAGAREHGLPNNTVDLTDPAGIQPLAGCSRPIPGDNTRVRCTADLIGKIDLRDGADSADLRGPIILDRLEGGDGDDVLSTRLVGPSYRPGDYVGTVTFVGGPGDDRMTGGGGGVDEPDVFDEGAAPNGSDTIRGSGTVDYSARRSGVRLNLDGRRNDGASGEGDELVGAFTSLKGGAGRDVLVGDRHDNVLDGGRGTDRIAGGGGADELVAGRGRTRDRLAGGRGRDTLRGSGGRNRLNGGPGGDELLGGGGADRIDARDHATDSVVCGRGRDRVRLDRLDDYARDCERVRRRGAASAVVADLTEVTDQVMGGGETTAIADIVCPPDGPRRCTGRVKITAAGHVIGRKRFRLRRGHDTVFEADIPDGVSDRQVVVVVRTRDARGRSRTIRASAATLPGERS